MYISYAISVMYNTVTRLSSKMAYRLQGFGFRGSAPLHVALRRNTAFPDNLLMTILNRS